MKNAHYPFELLGQIKDWLEKNKPVLSISAENARREIQKLQALERELQGFGMDTHQVLDKRIALEIKSQESMDPDFEPTILRLKEGLLSLSRYIDRSLKKQDFSVKALGKRLLVRFHDGLIINEKSAVDTFIKTLQQMGFDKCAECADIIQLGHPVVANRPNEYHGYKPGQIKEVDGFFVEVKSSTKDKAALLEKYAQSLRVDIDVQLID